MDQLIVKDLSSIKTTIGNVIIKPGPENNHIHIGEGDDKFSIWVDSSYQPEKHSTTWGEVVCVPDRVDEVLETSMELAVGDRIFFHYLSCMNAIRDRKYIIHEGQFYFVINYNSIFCAKRQDDVIPINGYILVEPVDDSLEATTIWGFIIPENIRTKNHCNIGKVKYAGTPLNGQSNNCKKGDLVFFRTHSNTPLQYDLFSNFEGKSLLYRMKGDNIYGIKNES